MTCARGTTYTNRFGNILTFYLFHLAMVNILMDQMHEPFCRQTCVFLHCDHSILTSENKKINKLHVRNKIERTNGYLQLFPMPLNISHVTLSFEVSVCSPLVSCHVALILFYSSLSLKYHTFLRKTCHLNSAH